MGNMGDPVEGKLPIVPEYLTTKVGHKGEGDRLKAHPERNQDNFSSPAEAYNNILWELAVAVGAITGNEQEVDLDSADDLLIRSLELIESGRWYEDMLD